MGLGSLFTLFFKWRDDGALRQIFLALSEDTNMENFSIDSTCVKVHESAIASAELQPDMINSTAPFWPSFTLLPYLFC